MDGLTACELTIQTSHAQRQDPTRESGAPNFGRCDRNLSFESKQWYIGHSLAHWWKQACNLETKLLGNRIRTNTRQNSEKMKDQSGP
jgi:hypothetical protein